MYNVHVKIVHALSCVTSFVFHSFTSINANLSHREYSIVLCNDDLPGMILDRVATAEYGPLPALWLKLQKFRPKSIEYISDGKALIYYKQVKNDSN